MGHLLVVVDHPPPCRLANILEASEQVYVQHFFTESPVESLDAGIPVRRAGLDVLDGHAIDF